MKCDKCGNETRKLKYHNIMLNFDAYRCDNCGRRMIVSNTHGHESRIADLK